MMTTSGDGLSIGVVIPAYRSGSTIGETLDAVAAQTVSPESVIVVVDGPDPETESVVRSHGSGVELFVLPANTGGPAIPRNAGLVRLLENHAIDAVWFLDADDLPDPRFLAGMSEAMARHPEADLVGARFTTWRIGEERPPGDPCAPSDAALGSIDLDSYLGSTGSLLPSFTLVRIRALSSLRDSEEPFDPDLPNNQDYEMFVRMLARRPGVRIEWSGGGYRLHPAGISAAGARVWSCRMTADKDLRDWFDRSGRPAMADRFDTASRSALRATVRHLWKRKGIGDRAFAIRLLACDITEKRSLKSILLMVLMPLGLDRKTRGIPEAGDTRSSSLSRE